MEHSKYEPMKNTSNTSVSMEPPLLAKAKKRARSRRQSFSAYVATLIESDVAKLMSEKRAVAAIEK